MTETAQSRLTEHTDLQPEEPRPDCRRDLDHLRLRSVEDPEETAPARCKQWQCACCGHRLRMGLIEELERVTEERPELRRLVTLTVGAQGPSDPEQQHGYITECWDRLKRRIDRRWPGMSYVLIRHEGDENGRAHIHLLVDRYLPQGWLSRAAAGVGLGEVVDIRRVNARNAVHYLSAYLGRGALADLPEGLHRYSSSADLDIDPWNPGEDVEQPDEEWVAEAWDPVVEQWLPAVKGDWLPDDRPPPEES